MADFTRRAIIESFVKLLNERPLEKITVKDIIDDCHINRSTFYYYYEDKYALLNNIFEQETNKIVESHTEYSTWADGIKEAVEFSMQNKKAIYHIYKSVSREALENYFENILGTVIYKAIMSQAAGLGAADDDIRLVADIYKYASMGLIINWVEHGMSMEPMAIVDKLAYMYEGSLKLVLTRALEYERR